MSEDEGRKLGHEEEQDEVEAHRRHIAMNEEPGDEMRKGETDEAPDVEAHRRHIV